jgi:hypothetical protein
MVEVLPTKALSLLIAKGISRTMKNYNSKQLGSLDQVMKSESAGLVAGLMKYSPSINPPPGYSVSFLSPVSDQLQKRPLQCVIVVDLRPGISE